MRQSIVKTFLCMASVLLMMLCMTVSAAAVEPDTSWYTGDGPYEISDVADLLGFAQLVNSGESFEGKTVKLTQDINLEGIDWIPIGSISSNETTPDYDDGSKWYLGKSSQKNGESSAADKAGKEYTLADNRPFKGTFIGEKKGTTARPKISNLKITKTRTANQREYLGLFGYILKGTVENIDLVEVMVDVENSTTHYVGAVAGYMYGGTIKDVSVSYKKNEVVELKNVHFGGAVGYLLSASYYNTTAKDYYYNNTSSMQNVDITGINVALDTAGSVNGITGYMHLYYEGNHSIDPPVSSFIDCDVHGMKVSASSEDTSKTLHIAGLTRWQQGRGTMNVTGCDITDLDIAVSGKSGFMVAGLVNVAYNAEISDSHTSGEIVDHGENTNTKIGGFVNGLRRDDNDNAHVRNCSADVDITSSNGMVGGFIGYADAVNENQTIYFEDCCATGDVSGRIAGGFAGVISTEGIGGAGKAHAIKIDGCTATGTVRGGEVAGGFLGCALNGTGVQLNVDVKNSGASGDVYCTGDVDGIRVNVYDENNVTFDNCWFTGRINPVDVVPDLPQTGDQSRMTLWMLLCAVSVVSMAALGKRCAGIDVKR